MKSKGLWSINHDTTMSFGFNHTSGFEHFTLIHMHRYYTARVLIQAFKPTSGIPTTQTKLTTHKIVLDNKSYINQITTTVITLPSIDPHQWDSIHITIFLE